jgi:hypothetical protein
LSLGGCPNACQPPVARVIDALHQTVLLEACYDSCHRWRLHLLRFGELTERERSTEDDDGESGKPGRRQAAYIILPAKLPQQVNRG